MSTAAKPAWQTICARHRVADDVRARQEVLLTVIPLALAWIAAVALYDISKVAVVAVDVVVAGFLMRLFVLQHDAGHGALFATRESNDRFGMVACVPLLVPYLEWRKSHAIHHKISSQLDHRIFPDIYTFTLAEYRAFPLWKKIAYRVFRHPLILFGVIPLYFFFVSCRIKGSMCPTLPRGRNLANLMATTTTATLMLVGLCWALGPGRVLLVFLPAQFIAGALGFWLFYVQHQAEYTFWARDSEWSYEKAALQGSSFLDLSPPLAWLTGWVGFHHVHHLDPRIPCWRLRDVHHDLVAAGVFTAPRLSGVDGLRTMQLTLWDEKRNRMVPFAAAEDAAEDDVAAAA
ncbi:MAG: fatty acid desaturase [Deltaproteobacteria bacterium]|nr:fatty acid desaturase [Deltaproteobacteria bacterium]